MDRTVLEAWIAEGLSLEEMGHRSERHPSTVSYWLRKHGLEAVRADVRSARGALDREELASLLEDGLSIREVAAVVDRSPATASNRDAHVGCAMRTMAATSCSRAAAMV